MKSTDIEVDKFYVAETSTNLSIVKVLWEYPTGGWYVDIIKTNNRVVIREVTRFLREATQGEIASKKVGVRLIKFEIPDGPRCEAMDELIKMMMDGATLPEMVKVNPPQPIPFGKRELAQVILDMTSGADAHDIQMDTGLPYRRCEEIIEIHDKLVDILK